MNIFVTNKNPTLCAIALDNVRVGTAGKEAVQILSTMAYRFPELCLDHSKLYKPTHHNHPVTLWSGESKEHYLWTLAYARACFAEYSFRFNRIHLSSIPLKYFVNSSYSENLDYWHLDVAKNLPQEFNNYSVFEGYKKVLSWKWKYSSRKNYWTNRNSPEWVE